MNTPPPCPDAVILSIPDIPPTPGVRGLTVSRKGGVLTIAEGSENPLAVLTLDEERAQLVMDAISRGLQTKLFLPPPEGKEPGYWESAPTLEESASFFQQARDILKEDLKDEGKAVAGAPLNLSPAGEVAQ